MSDWHCKQIPNGQQPIVVCERETLTAEIEQLRAEVGRLRNSVDTLTNMLSEQCDMSDRYALAANKAEAENERLHVAIYWLVADIDHAHLPDPMGRLCITCGAGDGSWPCIHRKALDELKKARRG